MRSRGARAAALAVLALAARAAAVEEPAPPPPPRTVQGRLEGRTVWSGEVRLEGDVEIPADASLLVEAGTRVLVSARDASSSGWDPQGVEIHVRGEFLVAGTIAKPVRFDCGNGLPTGSGPGAVLVPTPLWHGAVLWPHPDPSRRREVRGALFDGAFSAIQVPAGRAVVEDCVFLRCGTGVEAGSAYADARRWGTAGKVARPSIARSRFAGCRTGVYAELSGAPVVTRSVFVSCSVGAGNGRESGTIFPLQEPGVTLDRCDVRGCGKGVVGPFLVTGTIFQGNGEALSLSSFHAELSTGSDLYACRGNVFASNGAILLGESAAGDFLSLETPGYEGDLAALDAALRAPWPPLPDLLRLRPDSPARGRAPDGGDPGCLAPVPPAPPRGSWTSNRTRLLAPLLAAAPDPKAPGDPPDLARVRPVPGGSHQRSWWCRVEAPGDGVLRPRSHLGAGEAEGLWAWRIEGSSPGNATLEVNGDLLLLEAWWNGERVAGLVAPRRFDGEGATAGVAARSGTNHLLVRARGRGPDPRLGVAVGPPPGGGLREAGFPVPPAREGRVSQARIVSDREQGGAPFLRLAVSTPLSWAVAGTVRILRPTGEEVPPGTARVRFSDRQAILFGPLPEAALGGGSASLEGFAAPDGAPVDFRAGPAPFPPLPPR